MAKKRVSSVDLNWMLIERMKDSGTCPRGFAVAIVADDETGWRAVVETRSRRSLSPRAARQFAEIEKKLQAAYTLIVD